MFRRALVLATFAVVLLAGASPAAPRSGSLPTLTTAAVKTKVPQRIVSLSPTATGTLFAIGAGKQVIAVDDQSDFPRSAPRTRLSGFSPNAEAVAGYRPDLVVLHYDANRIVAALRQLRIPVIVQPPAKDLPAAYAQILRLGAATGHARAARTLVARTRTRVARIVAGSRGRARSASVYHEVSPDLYAASSRSFIGSVYRLFGVRNIADTADASGSGFPKLSAEYVIAQDPNLIVLADTRCCGQSRATVAARPGWNRIRAVRTGTIAVIDDAVAARWGPRVVDFVRAVGAALRAVSRA